MHVLQQWFDLTVVSVRKCMGDYIPKKWGIVAGSQQDTWINFSPSIDKQSHPKKCGMEIYNTFPNFNGLGIDK